MRAKFPFSSLRQGHQGVPAGVGPRDGRCGGGGRRREELGGQEAGGLVPSVGRGEAGGGGAPVRSEGGSAGHDVGRGEGVQGVSGVLVWQQKLQVPTEFSVSVAPW